MAVQLISTREAAQTNGLKVLVYGLAGSGKTRLCATTGGNPLIISAEAGLLSLREYDLAALSVNSMQDVHDAYEYAASEEGRQFDWICLDSVSEIAEVVLAYEKKQTKDPRKAYGELSDQMMDLLRAFRDLPGRNVYMTAKMRRTENDGANLFGPMMPGQQLAQQLPYLFDEFWALRVERGPDNEPQHWLQCHRDFQYEAKDRSGALEMFEAPDLAACAAKILGPKPSSETAADAA